MTIDQLREKVSALTRCDTTSDAIEFADIYLEYFFKVILEHHQDTVHSQQDADAKIIHQMMFTKLTHLRQLMDGVGFIAKSGKSLNKIIDPTIIASLVRNIYETVGLFNLVFIIPKTTDQKAILYSLWVSSGLKYRQRFSAVATTDQNKAKLAEEENAIRVIKQGIENTTLYKALSDPNAAKIQRLVKDKEYKMYFDNNEVKLLSWQDLATTMGCKHGFFDHIYTYFSLYSHPSQVAVFQFEGMFNKSTEEFKQLTLTILKMCFALLSIFAADYISYFPKVLETYNRQPLLDQIMINFYSKMLRGHGHSINDAWKELG